MGTRERLSSSMLIIYYLILDQSRVSVCIICITKSKGTHNCPSNRQYTISLRCAHWCCDFKVNNIYRDTCLQACFWRCQFMNIFLSCTPVSGWQTVSGFAGYSRRPVLSLSWSMVLSVIRLAHTCTNSNQLSNFYGVLVFQTIV